MSIRAARSGAAGDGRQTGSDRRRRARLAGAAAAGILCLLTVTRIAEQASLLRELAQASVHDRAIMTDRPGSLHHQRWHDPRRYDLVETLLDKALLSDAAASHMLDRLGKAVATD